MAPSENVLKAQKKIINVVTMPRIHFEINRICERDQCAQRKAGSKINRKQKPCDFLFFNR